MISTTTTSHPVLHRPARRRLLAAAITVLAIATSAATVSDHHAAADIKPSAPVRHGNHTAELSSGHGQLGVHPAGAAGPRHRVIEGLFDVGGYRLYLRCTGKGNPTVVMDASAGEDSSTWSDVERSLARVTRVCVYDRAGLGRSDDPEPVHPRTSQTMVDELTTLLRVAGVPGPYVLVGHSIAGFNVQVFTRQDGGDTVVGVVLIDATPPDFIAVLDSIDYPIPPPEDTENNPDGMDIRASAAQALTAGPFPPVPLAVLTHGNPGNLESLEEPWQEMQAAQSQLSPKGRLIVARKSGHYIQNDQPRLVVRAIVKVVAKARHNAAHGHAVSAAG